ncbi:MAG: enoyl-CoA hydratase/isomerase family protein [Candidatus Thalassarchaeaceae archaeon]|tara:strand:+ start:21112 stop:21945 length:834 start_codon:yes stop_codon:yes gene_type:complete
MVKKPDIDELTVEEVPSGTGVVVIATVNRPEKLNALNHEVKEAIKALATWADDADHVRVIIFQGAKPGPAPEGKRPKPNAFVAGADVSDFKGKDSATIRPEFEDNVWEAVWNISKPTIALIDGYALGGGSELAVSCDIRIATPRSMFGTPEINLGLIPGGGGTQRLTWLVGYGRAMEMVMGGGMIDAEEAHRIGLVNHVINPDSLMEKGMEIAENLASKSPLTIQVAKRAVRAALDHPISDGVLLEHNMFVDLFDTKDKDIGVNAFLERHTPEWTGE